MHVNILEENSEVLSNFKNVGRNNVGREAKGMQDPS